MVIKEVKIRNFRSIVKADIILNDLSIFVGFNDVGKSNILKALNLFFNEETDYETDFDFSEDYSKYAPKRKKKAEEITIELIISPPRTYKDSKDIRWIKIWRRDGFYDQDVSFADNTDFPSKSKLYSWLNNIRFSYIPAIRGNSYFQILLANLHDSLVETIEDELRNAGNDFIDKIKANTQSMITAIENRLKINSQIRFPSNLQSLFMTLDFATSEGSFDISLSNRGDGIKTRHIPVILKFISDQLNFNKRKGAPNVTMIWGYEEPENNLEMLAAYNLASEFIDYSNNIQILMTTHSPGFYTLKSKYPIKVNLFKVIKPKGNEAEISILDEKHELDVDMGIMPIITPYVNEKLAEINDLQKNISSYKNELSKFHKHVIFVEGEDEVRVFTEILKNLKLVDKVTVSKDGMGCSGVRNQVMAWSWVSGVAQFKAIGIFDNDSSGLSEYKKLTEEIKFKDAQNSLKVKALFYKAPSHLLNIKKYINTFPIELEEMYTVDTWKKAQSQGWLEPRSMNELHSFIKLDSLSQTLEQKLTLLGFTDDELIYIKYKIPDKHKDKASKYLCEDTSVTFNTKFEPLLKIFNEIIIPFINKT